jgi:hypothetical protein
MEVARYNVFINSSKRLTGTPTYFNVNLKQPLRLRNSKNYWMAKVESVQIPYSFKVVNATNNTLNITTIRGTTNSTTLTVPTGNYTITTLLSTLQSLLTTWFQTTYSYVPTFSFTYNSNTQFVTLAITGDATPTSIQFFFSGNFIGLMMGFTTNQTISFSPSATTTSTQSVLVNPISYLCLRSDTLIQNQAYESIVEQDVQSDILCKIPIVDLPRSWIQYEPPISLQLSNKIIDNIQVYLTNNLTYDLLDLNGLEWSFTISFTEIQGYEHEREDSLESVGQDMMELQLKRAELLDRLEKAKTKLKTKVENTTG